MVDRRTRSAEAASAGVRRPAALVAGAVFLIALLARLPVAGQSLWYDELYSLTRFVSQDWSAIVAGEWSPNNHTLYNLLAKLCVSVAGTGELPLRLPSLAAGSMVGLALAWPLRRSAPATAAMIGIFASLNPWLVASSAEARGYPLMLLLCVVATNCVFAVGAVADRAGTLTSTLSRGERQKRRPIPAIAYALAMAGAIYTIPIALAVIVGHGVAVLTLRRAAWRTWAMSAGGAIALAAVLYVPQFIGGLSYKPGAPSLPYTGFLADSAVHAVAGWRATDNLVGAMACILVLLISGRLGWAFEPSFRPLLCTFGTASVLGLVAPAIIPAAGEARFMHWLIPVFALGGAMWLIVIAGMLNQSWRPASRKTPLILLGLILLFAAATLWPLTRTPAQPIRDAIAAAREKAGDGGTVLAVYMAAAEARAAYGGIDAVAYDAASLRDLLMRPRGKTVAIVFYPHFLQRDQAELAKLLAERFDRLLELAGRVSPAVLYQTK